jgi:hypothetical protein
VKTCPTCEDELEIQDLVCLDCGEVLEDGPYTSLCFGAVVSAAALHGGLVSLGLYGRFALTEVIILTSVIIAVTYPAVKLVQKRRDPERPILAEILSVYTDRSDRVFFLLILAACILIVTGHAPAGALTRTPVHPQFALVRFIATTWGVVFFTLWILASILDQGLAFFDPRIANTYVHRERAKLAQHPDQ